MNMINICENDEERKLRKAIVIGARPGIGVRSGNRGSPGNRGRSGNKGSPPGIEVRHRKLRNDGY